MNPIWPEPIKAVLLDLDGTLLDTAPDFHRLINQLRDEQGLSPLPYLSVREQVSNGAAAMIQHAFPHLNNSPESESLRLQLLERYLAEPVRDSALFDGMDELLQWLEQHGTSWGIVTNKPERFCTPILDALNLTQRCASLICPDHVSRRKPDPEGLLIACSSMNIRPEQCLYVGDHRRDIEAGHNAAMMTAAARYGYIEASDPADSWGAELVVNNVAQLREWLDTQRN